MIPILFDKNETAFTSNGLGRLTDCTRCEVTEERNGVYEAEFDYPINGPVFGELTEGRYIYTTHDESKTPQAFQIYFKSAPLEGVCTFRAWHISYLLNGIVVAPFTATSAADAISKIAPRSINANPFEFWTDKAVTGAYKLSVPTPARAVLGGGESSLLDVYGKGDYEFDMFTVKLHVNRGSNRGVSIRYGKNLVSLEQERDASSVYSGVVPFWSDSDGEQVVTLDHVVYKTGESSGNAVAHDFSDDYEDAPTTAQLEAAAQSWINGTDSVEIKENITVDFVALWQTEEYKNYANLQRIYLCDTVNIYYEKLGINATAKCIKTVYDSLRERYTSMELGTPKTTLARQILETTSDTLLKNVPSKTAMQSAIDKATEMIAGGFGGYIKFKYLSDGTPSEMLIMNTADEATATNIIRLNQNGIGFSTDGGTTYRNAWTIDGHLNADFINAGTLSGVRVEATSGNIGRWEINSSALYKDVQGSDGYVYRVYFQPPLASGAVTWVLSCQKSKTQGSVGDNLIFDGVFILYSDGSAKFGDTTISSAGIIRAKTLYTADANITGGQITLTGSNGTTYVDDEKIRYVAADGKAYEITTDGFVVRSASGGILADVGINGVRLYDNRQRPKMLLQPGNLTLYAENASGVWEARGTAIFESYFTDYDGMNGFWELDNGLAMCWQRVSLSGISVQTAWGSMYESGEISLGNMPYTFAAKPTISATIAGTPWGLMIERINGNSASSWGNIIFTRPTRATDATCDVCLFAVGARTWD